MVVVAPLMKAFVEMNLTPSDVRAVFGPQYPSSSYTHVLLMEESRDIREERLVNFTKHIYAVCTPAVKADPSIG